MKRKHWLILGLIGLFYLVVHLVELTALPVFADEAIYIRWAQLILDEPGRYLFFPLNDGKTPLFIWLQVPFQWLFTNGLLAGRLAAVLVGLGQLTVTALLLRELKVRQVVTYLGLLLVTILPFWYLHHRLALMDGLLTLGISLAYLGVLRVGNQPAKPLASIGQSVNRLVTYWSDKSSLVNILLIGLGLGAALWSKIPAILAIPAFFLPVIFVSKKNIQERADSFLQISLGTFLGLASFALLRFNPVFSQLFRRGEDFLYPISQVLFAGVWQQTIINFPNYISYFANYLSPSLLLLMLAGLFISAKQKRTHMLFWGGILFCLPITLFGKVVFPRYLFPASLFFTLAGLSSIDGILQTWLQKDSSGQFKAGKTTIIAGVVLAFLVTNVIITGVEFVGLHLQNPNQTPFVTADREQYLTSWSSGHGITQTVELINRNSQDQTLAVATEGYFGTLPDGLLLYLHDQDVSNLYVEGIGVPVRSLPDSFINRAAEFDQIWLVVNSHRLEMPLEQQQLVAEYCRPYQAPCLQVWDVTALVVSPE